MLPLIAWHSAEPAELQEVAWAGTRDPNPAHQDHHPCVVKHNERSPRCEALSPTTSLNGGSFVSAFTSCLAAPHRPGPRVVGWDRGQGKGISQEGSPWSW